MINIIFNFIKNYIMTSYIIGDNNKNNYDLDYIPYGRILQERINETIVSPDNMIQCILYTLHLAGYYTFEYYTSILKQLLKSYNFKLLFLLPLKFDQSLQLNLT